VSNAAPVYSLARRHRRTGPWINSALVLALGLLCVGLFAPLLSLEQFFVFSSQVSLLSGLSDLAGAGQWPLFAVLLGFSVVLPLLKLGLLFRVWNLEAATEPSTRRHLRWMAEYGRWSMLDVFVVAILVVSVKLGVLAEVRVEYGLYAFATSVLLTMAVSHWVLRLADQGAHDPRNAS
jgi:paraquat-inducible protein A